jgi:hypothetical protein
MEKISIIGVTFTFFNNYIEVRDKLGFGGFLFPKKSMILYKNIASVDANIATGKLIIETTGGKTFKYHAGFSTGKIRDAIMMHLQ